jgi:predicted  nucleic acid-binding Zn-ribbon protein
MKAQPDAQLLVLQLQALDTELDQLRHRRDHMPQAALVAELTTSARVMADRLTAIAVEIGDLEREQRRAENDVEVVRLRSSKDAELLDSGSILDPKQLQSLQAEIASLARRQGDLEDVELEVLERLEEAQKVQRQLRDQEATLRQQVIDATVERDTATAEIQAEEDSVSADRARLRTRIPADFLALYEKLRADKEGVGAAALHRGRCEGCRIELTPVDISRLRDAPADDVMRCEECRRILIRTDESGL